MSTISRLSFIGGVLSKILYFTFYDILGRILLLCGYKVVCVRVRKILQVLEWMNEAETYHLEHVAITRLELCILPLCSRKSYT